MVSKAPKRVQVESEPFGRRGQRWVYPGLIVLVVIVNAPSLLAGYHADDWSHSYIPRKFSGIGDLWNPPFPFSASFRPVYAGHLWALSQISEGSLPIARLWIVLLHGFACILVFEIAALLSKGSDVRVPSIAAAWFAVAFCHFEVPAALTNSETPGAILFLLTVFVLMKSWPLRSLKDQIVFVTLWMLALGAKEYALWIPGAWFLAHLFSRNRARMALSGWLVPMAPLVGVSCAYLLRLLSLDRNAEDLAFVRDPGLSLEGMSNLVSSIASLPCLDPAHPRWSGLLEENLGLPPVLLSAVRLLLLGVVAAAVWFNWRHGNRRQAAMGAALILCPLALSCWLPGPAASRHTYLPSAGFGILLALGYERIRPNKECVARIALAVALLLNAAGSIASGWKLTQVTRERERITEVLRKDLEDIGLEQRVILAGLEPRLRVGMSLPFLFPDRKLDTLEPSPLLEAQPLELLRANPPSEAEAVVLDWDGNEFNEVGLFRLLSGIEGGANPAPR